MQEEIQVSRWVDRHLPLVDSQGLVLLTGARQTGKTTSAKSCYAGLPYYNLDAIEYRKV